MSQPEPTPKNCGIMICKLSTIDNELGYNRKLLEDKVKKPAWRKQLRGPAGVVMIWVAITYLMIPRLAMALTASQVYEQVKDSVVVVKAYNQQDKLVGLGSGVMLPSGDIVTNCHVLKAGVRYTVGQGKELIPATIRASDPERDLCLLRAPGLAARPARLGHTTRLKVGEPVYALGAPQGLELSLSEGIVSQLRGGLPPRIQTTAAISPGSSGRICGAMTCGAWICGASAWGVLTCAAPTCGEPGSRGPCCRGPTSGRPTWKAPI